ncbi:MAG: ribonuclease HII [Coriobacteriales bacterium]|jgi:ribonuclease HII|nr:ribonuclease HII [Coriobacteriales bacterium]
MVPRASTDETERTAALYREQLSFGATAIVVGLDEVGRGPVAGSLTVCAVVLPAQPQIRGLDDSKRLTAKKREALCGEIKAVASAWNLAHIAPEDIDAAGMAACLRRAFSSALGGLELERDPDAVLIDGNPLGIHPRERNIIKGDAKVASIAAASIVAKVTRDALMVKLDAQYPGYGLAQNKGYASPEHIKAIQTLGLSPVHRKTFCHNFLQQSLF